MSNSLSRLTRTRERVRYLFTGRDGLGRRHVLSAWETIRRYFKPLAGQCSVCWRYDSPAASLEPGP